MRQTVDEVVPPPPAADRHAQAAAPDAVIDQPTWLPTDTISTLPECMVMLIQQLRQLERDGIVQRIVHHQVALARYKDSYDTDRA